jgi:sugar phosphate isomerase/epimerase
MTRRQLLSTAGSAAAVFSMGKAIGQPQAKPLHNIGGAPAGFPVRSRQARDTGKPFDFLEHCHTLGLRVFETRLQSIEPAAIKSFRQRVDSYNMRAIADIPLPKDEAGVPAFDAAVKAAKEAGIISLHSAMTQRRYEEFDSFEAFKTNFERCQRTVALAEPVLRRHQMRLGLENHKGWRASEQAAWIKRIGSEWVGVHFDFGNNLSLCEDPAETLRILQPYAFACHLKDMAVEPYEDGFLLSEVPLGEGMLDIPGMVQSLRKKDPNMPFDLEMITRDPLKIPVFTKKYWATFDDSYSPLPGRDLARVLELVQKNKPRSPLPRMAGLSAEAQLKLEDDCIAKSIAYARQHLES